VRRSGNEEEPGGSVGRFGQSEGDSAGTVSMQENAIVGSQKGRVGRVTGFPERPQRQWYQEGQVLVGEEGT
jgi:hypothetical protein